MSASTTSQVPARLNTRWLFDFGFGVIAPIICLIADPVIFKGASFLAVGGLLAPFKVAAYTAIGLGVAALAIWLTFRPRLLAHSDFFAGLFLMAQISAFLSAVIILPMSIIGIGMGGILGLIPFVTAFVFSRQHKQAQIDSAA